MSLQVIYGLTLKGVENRAWDEEWYGNGAVPEDVLNDWIKEDGTVDPSVLLYHRLALLSSSCAVYYIRGALVGESVRRSRRMLVNLPGTASDTVDNPSSGPLYIASDSGDQVRRQIHLRGIPDSWVENAQLTSTGKRGLQGINTGAGLFGQMRAKNVRMRFRQGTILGTSSRAIVGATKDGQYGLIKIQLETGDFTSVGSMIDLVRLPRQPQLRGTWQVAALQEGPVIPPNTATSLFVTLRGSERVSCPTFLTGRAINRALDTAILNTFDFAGIRTKETGKKKFVPRGRSSAKLIRR